jgi:hypothetical protein
MTRIAGIFIILAGLAMFAFGSLPVLAIAHALIIG